MSSGYSRIESTGVTFDYPRIDLENKLVIARVLFNGDVKMQVIIDLQKNTVKKEGNIDDLAFLTGMGGRIFNEQNIIENLRRTALFYVENNISDPMSS